MILAIVTRAVVFACYAFVVTYIQQSHGWHGFLAGAIYGAGLSFIALVPR